MNLPNNIDELNEMSDEEVTELSNQVVSRLSEASRNNIEYFEAEFNRINDRLRLTAVRNEPITLSAEEASIYGMGVIRIANRAQTAETVLKSLTRMVFNTDL